MLRWIIKTKDLNKKRRTHFFLIIKRCCNLISFRLARNHQLSFHPINIITTWWYAIRSIISGLGDGTRYYSPDLSLCYQINPYFISSILQSHFPFPVNGLSLVVTPHLRLHSRSYITVNVPHCYLNASSNSRLKLWFHPLGYIPGSITVSVPYRIYSIPIAFSYQISSEPDPVTYYYKDPSYYLKERAHVS